jgi:hypothetical protein
MMSVNQFVSILYTKSLFERDYVNNLPLVLYQVRQCSVGRLNMQGQLRLL